MYTLRIGKSTINVIIGRAAILRQLHACPAEAKGKEALTAWHETGICLAHSRTEVTTQLPDSYSLEVTTRMSTA